jgi:hypothetical protein
MAKDGGINYKISLMKLFVKIIIMCVILSGCQNYHAKKEIISDALVSKISLSTSDNNRELFHIIKSLDSLFFDSAYNKCDSTLGRTLISKNFEFYHDKGGALTDEASELASDIMVEDLSWICNDTYRKLVDNKMEVFPLYDNNELYGAIQTGDHKFYKVENSIPTELDINAKFIHLWILEGNVWKLRRVFSFDHQKVIKINTNN